MSAVPRLTSLPRAEGRFKLRYRGTPAQEQDAKERQAYFEATGKDPYHRQFTGGLAEAQWSYGMRGSRYWTLDARGAVRLMSQVT